MESKDPSPNQTQNKGQNQSETAQKETSDTQPIEFKASSNRLSKILPFLIIIVVIAAGIMTGLIMSSVTKSSSQAGHANTQEELSGEIKENFAQTFKDEAEGTLEKNDDLDKYAQGTHKLKRPGGEDQTAYLTSSVLDLSEYVGKKVKVYGETFGSSQVGWLMDVGKVEVIE